MCENEKAPHDGGAVIRISLSLDGDGNIVAKRAGEASLEVSPLIDPAVDGHHPHVDPPITRP